MAEGYGHLDEPFDCFGITVLGDNSLSKEVFEAVRHPKGWDPEYHSMEPHVFCQTGRRQVHMNDLLWIWNLSGSKRALGQLLYESGVRNWATQNQQVTVLGLGAQDLIKGVYNKEVVEGNEMFWENEIIRITQQMVEIKRQHYEKHGRQLVYDKWVFKHIFVVYPLPGLPASQVEVCGKITHEEYSSIRRKQARRWHQRGALSKLRQNNIYVVRPGISNPTFRDGRLDLPFREAYVKPIFECVRERFCAFCKEPHVYNRRWINSAFRPAQGQFNMWNRLEEDVWRKILNYLSLFDIWTCRLTSLAFYRMTHTLLNECEGPLDIEAEIVRIRVP